MEILKMIILSLNIICLSSCSAAFGLHHKDRYEEGYRQGVKEQVEQVGSEFKGANYPYYHWAAPMVQEVLTPAQISNGVMIPEHKQLVIIKPGEWVMRERRTYDNHAAHSHHNDVSNLTVLP